MSDSSLSVALTRFPNVAPDQLLDKVSASSLAAALIYTPNAFHTAKIVDGRQFEVVIGDNPRPADLASAYEIRAFGAGAELRWVRAGIAGEAVWIEDVAAGVAATPGAEIAETIAQFDRSYRVWGKRARRTNAPEGWSAVSSARTGIIYVPLQAEGERALVLRAREYVGLGPFGNAAVLFERLVGFAVA